MKVTKELITENINDPMALEDLYRYSDGKTFSEAVKAMFEEREVKKLKK